MAEDVISIGIALNTGPLLAGTRQVDTALKQVAAASATTAQATQKIDASAKTAGQALTAESQAAQAAGQALRQMAQASSSAGQAAVQLGQQVNTASGFLTRLGEQALAFGAGQAGIMGVAAAFSKVKEALTGAVQSAMNLESMTATFKAISGSSQAAEKDMDFLRQTATRLGIDFTSLSKGFVTLSSSAKNTSLSGAALRDIFTAIAEKGRVLGKSADDINGALLAVGQSISKGTIQAEELRGQLSERLPGAFNDMARAMGVSTAELNKLLEAGKVGIENWAAWAAVVRRDLGNATEDAAKTASAAIARLGNATGELSTTIGKALLPSLTATVNLLTGVVTAANSAAKALSSFDEARRKSFKEAETLAGGPGIQPDVQRQLVEAQDARRKAREERLAMERWGEPLLGGGAPGSYIEAARQRELAAIAKEIELKKQLGDVNKSVQLGRGGAIGEMEGPEIGARNEKLIAAEKQLVDMTKANRAELEKLDRTTQQLYGRKPTQDEILKTTEKQVETTRKWIDANQENWNVLKDTGPAKELRAAAAGSEALEKSIKAAADAVREKGKADSEAEQKRKQAEKDEEENARKSIDQLRKLGEEDERNIEQLRRMAAQYTEVKTVRDADTASQLAASLATTKHSAEAEKHLKVIQDTTRALEDRRKVEEKLPALREEAQASKGVLDDLNRLQKQLEPSRRGMSTEERLAGTRAEIAAKSGNDPAWLKKADTQIKETLDTELWDKWRDAGLDALDHVGQALEEFVFKGKLNFKDLLGSIAQDIFRTSLQIVQQQLTKKGGWGEMALEWGLKALNIGVKAIGGGGGGGGGGFGGTGSYIDADFMQHGGPVSAGSPYWVGEGGKPELFVPRTSGTVVPMSQVGGGPTVVNVHVSGVQDAQSFVQSRGAVSRAMMGALSQARQQM